MVSNFDRFGNNAACGLHEYANAHITNYWCICIWT